MRYMEAKIERVGFGAPQMLLWIRSFQTRTTDFICVRVEDWGTVRVGCVETAVGTAMDYKSKRINKEEGKKWRIKIYLNQAR